MEQFRTILEHFCNKSEHFGNVSGTIWNISGSLKSDSSKRKPTDLSGICQVFVWGGGFASFPRQIRSSTMDLVQTSGRVRVLILPPLSPWSCSTAGEAAVISMPILHVIRSPCMLAGSLLYIRLSVGVGLQQRLILFSTAYANC